MLKYAINRISTNSRHTASQQGKMFSFTRALTGMRPHGFHRFNKDIGEQQTGVSRWAAPGFVQQKFRQIKSHPLETALKEFL